MTRTPAIVAAALFALCMAPALSAATPVAPAPRHPDANDTYTITSRLELVPPFALADMNDPFQDARLVTRGDRSSTFEITYYPLYRPTVGENAHWHTDYAGMTEYLRPTPTENWDEAMRRDLLAELRTAGIGPGRLTDKQLVEQVSRWAMRRSRSTKTFAVWTIHFPEQRAEIFPTLRRAFERERERSNPSWTDEQMISQEVFGRSMFYEKVHGSCTSSSIYLTTIFRALGIPTRVVFCIPPFDANDAAQARMFYAAIHHNEVRETVRKALAGMRGFANHLFNEVYVGHQWVRLNTPPSISRSSTRVTSAC
jgi:transglutaminase-like putative cysteine protease